MARVKVKMDEAAKERLRAVQAARKGTETMKGYDAGNFQRALDWILEFRDGTQPALLHKIPDDIASRFRPPVRELIQLSRGDLVLQAKHDNRSRPLYPATTGAWDDCGCVDGALFQSTVFSRTEPAHCRVPWVRFRKNLVHEYQVDLMRGAFPHTSVWYDRYTGPLTGTIQDVTTLFRARDAVTVLSQLFPGDRLRPAVRKYLVGYSESYVLRNAAPGVRMVVLDIDRSRYRSDARAGLVRGLKSLSWFDEARKDPAKVTGVVTGRGHGLNLHLPWEKEVMYAHWVGSAELDGKVLSNTFHFHQTGGDDHLALVR